MTQKVLASRDFAVFIQHYRGELTMNEAAEAIGFHPQTVFRAIRADPDWKAEVIEARAFKKQRRAEKAVKNIEKIGDTEGHKDQLRANIVIAEVYDEDFRSVKQRVELTGADGGAIQIEPKVVSLSALRKLEEERGIAGDIGLDRSQRALSPPGEVRPPPSE